MWSIYDTLILLTGLITAAIAILPVAGIERRTRLVSLLVGGGLVVLAGILGGLRSFTYPSVVWVGPVIALLAAGTVVARARKAAQPGGADLQQDESAHSVSSHPLPADPLPVTAQRVGAAQQPSTQADSQADGPRLRDWTAVHDPATPAADLAEIVARHPEFGPAALAHPNAYPELREWIRRYAAGQG